MAVMQPYQVLGHWVLRRDALLPILASLPWNRLQHAGLETAANLQVQGIHCAGNANQQASMS